MVLKEVKKIEQVIHLINSNITRNGVKRYDFADVRGSKFAKVSSITGKIIYKILLLMDSLFPIGTRKLLGIEKTYFPTTFSHLAESYMLFDIIGFEEVQEKRAIELLEMSLNVYYYNNEIGPCWFYNENHEFLNSSSVDKVSTMPLHGLARLNIALIKASKLYGELKFIEIAVDTALFTLKQHQLQKFDDGRISISYFYNSNDSTINVNTEFLQWISMIPTEYRTTELNSILNGILKFVIKEQNEDGSWYYYSKKHMAFYGNTPSIDCHHTGTVLSNLLYVLENESSLEDELRNRLKYSIEIGYEFYINSFFDFKTGCAKNILGYRRPAGPVQYSEAIIAMCEFKKSVHFISSNLMVKIDNILPKIVKEAIKFVKKDGSVPSEKILVWLNIDSIRWGNGILMQALLNYYSLITHKKNAVEENENEYK